ncbi:hypothetical protein C8F04DRAFT_1083256 [Mycena alexandri]|uniref:Thioredoxin domain-containing protein n=1 Tax=Mycena alexandri TaxID=1745969 RepID=A0AAD6T5Y3_9AGAR|nr:hypothetical protein C8F04DRAFT_1083256 [Mycena alexandri]
MPLNIADSAIKPAALLDRPEEFLIFYSDVVDGQLWCPDCRVVDDQVRGAFTAANSPSAVIVYVGNRPDWKSTDNIFRGEPFKITTIPTIVKLKENKEAGRLVDTEIKTGLDKFVAS